MSTLKLQCKSYPTCPSTSSRNGSFTKSSVGMDYSILGSILGPRIDGNYQILLLEAPKHAMDEDSRKRAEEEKAALKASPAFEHRTFGRLTIMCKNRNNMRFRERII